MAIPDFQSLMLPVLIAASKGEVRIQDVVNSVGADLGLSQDEMTELLPSGNQSIFANRIHWARFYLLKSSLIKATRRSHFDITFEGKAILKAPPDRIDIKFLKKFTSFEGFKPTYPIPD
jgi:restriction system protein